MVKKNNLENLVTSVRLAALLFPIPVMSVILTRNTICLIFQFIYICYPENVLMVLPIFLYIRYTLNNEVMSWHSNAGRTSLPGSNNNGCNESKDICKNKCILKPRFAMRTVGTKTKRIHSQGR